MKAMGQIITHYSSPLGAITLAGESEFLTGLWFDGQKHFAEPLPLEHRRVPSSPFLPWSTGKAHCRCWRRPNSG